MVEREGMVEGTPPPPSLLFRKSGSLQVRSRSLLHFHTKVPVHCQPSRLFAGCYLESPNESPDTPTRIGAWPTRTFFSWRHRFVPTFVYIDYSPFTPQFPLKHPLLEHTQTRQPKNTPLVVRGTLLKLNKNRIVKLFHGHDVTCRCGKALPERANENPVGHWHVTWPVSVFWILFCW